jgi:hypothetical protein
MRLAIVTALLLVPTLGLTQLNISNTPTLPAGNGPRVMAVQPTQGVRYAGDLLQLRERLQLSDSQQAAWALFQASVEAYSEQHFAEAPLVSYATEPAPRQIELLANTLEKRLVALRIIEHNAQALYVQLDAIQKQMADRHFLASVPVFGNPPVAR